MFPQCFRKICAQISAKVSAKVSARVSARVSAKVSTKVSAKVQKFLAKVFLKIFRISLGILVCGRPQPQQNHVEDMRIGRPNCMENNVFRAPKSVENTAPERENHVKNMPVGRPDCVKTCPSEATNVRKT